MSPWEIRIMNKRVDIFLVVLMVILIAWYYIYLQGKNSGVTEVMQPQPVPDTAQPVINSKSVTKTYPLTFDAAFIDGTTIRQDHFNFTFHVSEIGMIRIETGKIIACDNVNQFAASPFTQLFPTGEFPVQLAVAKESEFENVAFARILFSTDSIAHWEFALLPGQESIPITDSTFYYYPVDAGTGLFVDSAANAAFNKLDERHWNEAFIAGMEASGYMGYLYEFNQHNMAIFATGYGDGRYSTYIGYNVNNEPCCLLTDFALVSWWNTKPN